MFRAERTSLFAMRVETGQVAGWFSGLAVVNRLSGEGVVRTLVLGEKGLGPLCLEA